MTDPRCVYCNRPCGLQMLCTECFEKYREGLLPPLRKVQLALREREHAERLSNEESWVALFFTAALMGLVWWLFCVIWLGAGR